MRLSVRPDRDAYGCDATRRQTRGFSCERWTRDSELALGWTPAAPRGSHRSGDEGRANGRRSSHMFGLFGGRIAILWSPRLRHSRSRGTTRSRARELVNRAFRRLPPKDYADPRLDAHSRPEGSYVRWNISKHALPRVLSSPGLSEIRIPRLLAHARVLRTRSFAVPPRAWHAAQAPILDPGTAKSLAHRLAAHAPRRLIADGRTRGTLAESGPNRSLPLDTGMPPSYKVAYQAIYLFLWWSNFYTGQTHVVNGVYGRTS